MSNEFWEMYKKYKIPHYKFGWDLTGFLPTFLYDAPLDDDGHSLIQYSLPVLAIDGSGIPRIAVFVMEHIGENSDAYAIDANTGEKIEVEKWSYIQI